MKLLNWTFFIAVYKDGKRMPTMDITPAEYALLCSAITGRSSVWIEKMVERIKNVLFGTEEYFRFGDDYRTIIIEKDEATFEDGLELYDSFTLPPFEILYLMEDWLDFIQTYERGDIPGLPLLPPNPKK
jgi:hypothetical protein